MTREMPRPELQKFNEVFEFVAELDWRGRHKLAALLGMDASDDRDIESFALTAELQNRITPR